MSLPKEKCKRLNDKVISEVTILGFHGWKVHYLDNHYKPKFFACVNTNFMVFML